MLHPDFEYANTTISLSDIKCMFEFNISGYKTSTLIKLKHFCVLQKYLLKHHVILGSAVFPVKNNVPHSLKSSYGHNGVQIIG